MLERGLLPDFSLQVLAELVTIHAPEIRAEESTRDLRTPYLVLHRQRYFARSGSAYRCRSHARRARKDPCHHCRCGLHEEEDAAKKVERQVGKSAAAMRLESRIGQRFDGIVTALLTKALGFVFCIARRRKTGERF